MMKRPQDQGLDPSTLHSAQYLLLKEEEEEKSVGRGGGVRKESSALPASAAGAMVDRMREIDRLLSRLPAEERAQATETLVQMRSALEHATKRLALDLETEEEVRPIASANRPRAHTLHQPTHRRPIADNSARCIGRR
jgi:hypothetical protein